MVRRYVVLRHPSSGPPALIATPNDFATEQEAKIRIAEIENNQLMPHHTYLSVMEYEGDKFAALDAACVIY